MDAIDFDLRLEDNQIRTLKETDAKALVKKMTTNSPPTARLR